MERPQIGKQLARLTDLVGWMYTDAGRWARDRERIPNYDDSFNRHLTGLSGVGLEDLQFITARPITIESEQFVLLTFGRDEGSYEYPRIMEDWRDYTTWYWFVVHPERVAALFPKAVESNVTFVVDLDPLLCGLVNDAYGQQLSLSRIADNLIENKQNDVLANCPSGLNFRLFPVDVDGSRVVRFYAFQDYDTPLWGTHLHQGISRERFGSFPSERTPKAFDRYYYETDRRTFEMFVRAASQGAEPGPGSNFQGEAAEQRRVYEDAEIQPTLIGGLASIQPVYPDAARLAELEGTVIVTFVVSPRGNVEDPEVIRSPYEVFNQAAIEAVRKARFAPGQSRGRPVPVRFSLPVTFRLR